MSRKRKKNEVRNIVKDVLDTELKSLLHDVTYRMETLYATQMNMINNTITKIGSRDLNLAQHVLDGYVIEDNKPTAGSIQWTDCNIVYKGVPYTIQNGNTNKKYVYWQFSATDKTLLQTSDTKPNLTEDDVLLFINDGGKHSTVIGSGKFTHGAAIANGSLTGSEIKNDAISTLQLAPGAVDSTILASGAVTSGAIASGAVGSTAIASGAVTSGKLGTGAVGSTNLASGAVTSGAIASGAVGSTALAANAVTSGAIAAGAVTSGKLGTGAVASTNIADGAVSGSKIATGTITGANIQNGAIGNAQIGAGAIATDKLNMAMHMIF